MTLESLELSLFRKFQSARCKFFLARVRKEEKREYENDFMTVASVEAHNDATSILAPTRVRDRKSIISVHEAPLVLPF
jgi:hypothetical protein